MRAPGRCPGRSGRARRAARAAGSRPADPGTRAPSDRVGAVVGGDGGGEGGRREAGDAEQSQESGEQPGAKVHRSLNAPRTDKLARHSVVPQSESTAPTNPRRRACHRGAVRLPAGGGVEADGPLVRGERPQRRLGEAVLAQPVERGAQQRAAHARALGLRRHLEVVDVAAPGDRVVVRGGTHRDQADDLPRLVPDPGPPLARLEPARASARRRPPRPGAPGVGVDDVGVGGERHAQLQPGRAPASSRRRRADHAQAKSRCSSPTTRRARRATATRRTASSTPGMNDVAVDRVVADRQRLADVAEDDLLVGDEPGQAHRVDRHVARPSARPCAPRCPSARRACGRGAAR